MEIAVLRHQSVVLRRQVARPPGLVFTSKTGVALDAANVRRAFRRVARLAGLDPNEWTPRELRHSFVSIMSDSGVRLEDIADLCGHAGTTVTDKVYRHQRRDGRIRTDDPLLPTVTRFALSLLVESGP